MDGLDAQLDITDALDQRRRLIRGKDLTTDQETYLDSRIYEVVPRFEENQDERRFWAYSKV